MSDDDFPNVAALLASLTLGDRPVAWSSPEVHILLRGGCTYDDFTHAVDAWVNQPVCTRGSGTPWGFIRAVALRRRGEIDADQALQQAKAKARP